MSRTVIDLAPAVDPWPVIDAWAAAKKFTLTGYGEWGRAYSHGDGFWTAMVKVQIERVHIEAVGPVLRVSAWVPFWGVGSELAVHDISFFQYFPRKKGQRLVNDLLGALGAPTL